MCCVNDVIKDKTEIPLSFLNANIIFFFLFVSFEIRYKEKIKCEKNVYRWIAFLCYYIVRKTENISFFSLFLDNTHENHKIDWNHTPSAIMYDLQMVTSLRCCFWQTTFIQLEILKHINLLTFR